MALTHSLGPLALLQAVMQLHSRLAMQIQLQLPYTLTRTLGPLALPQQ